MQESDSHPRVLLVEGSEDKYFVLRIRRRSKLPENFCVKSKGGKVPLLQSIGAEADVEGRTILGILLDADKDPNACWRKVMKELEELRQEEHIDLPELPHQPDPKGTIIDGKPKIGIWLMPDDQSPGELEDFVAKMIPHNDPMWPLSVQYIDEIPE